MANANTSYAVYNLALGNVITTASAFPIKNPIGGSQGGYGASTIVQRAVVTPTISPAGSFDLFDGRPFRIRYSMLVTAGASLNFTHTLYWSSGLNTTDLTTVTNDTALYTVTLATGSAKSGVLAASHMFIWDSTTQVFGGFTEYVYQGSKAEGALAIVSPTILGAGSSLKTAGVATEAAALGNGFYLTALFGTSNASNAVILKELALEQV